MPDTLIARGPSAPSSNGNGAGSWAGELTALESRAELDSLEDLQQRRRELVSVNGALIARYGSFGLHDDYRKSFVETQKVKARMALASSGDKVTEGRIDAEAYGSDAYAAFLDNALAEKVEYLRVQNEIDELNEKIRSRELAILSYNAELKLAR
jgi:hypothetical protein